MGKQGLDSYEYDEHLAGKSKGSRGARRELKERHDARKNTGYAGWHWGLGDKPIKCKDKEEFKRELKDRNLMMRDEVKRKLR